jgi:hypothetical protein
VLHVLAGFFLGLHVDSEDRDSMFFRNISDLVPDYTASISEDETFHSDCCENLKSIRRYWNTL